MIAAGLFALCISLPDSQRVSLPTYDLVIRNGMIVDGSGNPAYYGDLAVQNGKIEFIGKVSGRGTEEIDANGMVVAPGFIDVHTHAENVIALPKAENFVRMGVTSIVIGNCGGSELDLGSFFAQLDSKPVSVNVASLVGQNTVRRAAMGGDFDRIPTETELNKMRATVRRAMEDGAVGLSTGLIYLPGTYSSTEEIIELAKVSSQFNGLYATHMRSEGTNIFAAIDEMLRIGREANCRVQYSHIKLSGENVWGRTSEVLDRIEKARADGLEITQDQYAYTASSTSISTLLPDSALEGGTAELKKRLDDPIQRAAIAKDMTDRLALRKRTDYAYAVIASCRADSRLNGKTLVEAAQIRLGKSSLADQIETVFWIQLNGGASAVFHGMNEDDVKSFMQHPNTMVASDASCRAYGEGVPHPRGYGNNARVFARYVRDLETIRLEDAVRKMTSLPAQTFRLANRGMLKRGMAADITIFDPSKVTDPSTYSAPHAYATGFKAVIVNGKVTVKNDVHVGTRAGVPLRRDGYLPRTVASDFTSTKQSPVSLCCAGG